MLSHRSDHHNWLFILYVAGASEGLKMMLDTHLEEYTKDVVVNNYHQQGLVLHAGYDPYIHTLSNPTGLTPGKHYWLALTKETKVFQPPQVEVFKKPCVGQRNLTHLKGKANASFRLKLTSYA